MKSAQWDPRPADGEGIQCDRMPWNRKGTMEYSRDGLPRVPFLFLPKNEPFRLKYKEIRKSVLTKAKIDSIIALN